ncbi:MAG: hypothetical protein EXS31_18665 [Pedosphaera sp.]|nr:hypothetical protein [Pedosphaera sp.]
MKILFDQGVPKLLRSYLATHEVQRAFQLGWAQKKNGELLALAEAAGFNHAYPFSCQSRLLRVTDPRSGPRLCEAQHAAM